MEYFNRGYLCYSFRVFLTYECRLCRCGLLVYNVFVVHCISKLTEGLRWYYM
jgi:hypothetical protein